MPTLRTYLVSFSPAKRTTHGFQVELGVMAESLNKRMEVTAASLPDLEKEVRRLAAEYGQTCSPYIRLKDRSARKPAGFDKFCTSLQIINAPAPVAAS
jgi:hypothetical protein